MLFTLSILIKTISLLLFLKVKKQDEKEIHSHENYKILSKKGNCFKEFYFFKLNLNWIEIFYRQKW